MAIRLTPVLLIEDAIFLQEVRLLRFTVPKCCFRVKSKINTLHFNLNRVVLILQPNQPLYGPTVPVRRAVPLLASTIGPNPTQIALVAWLQPL